MSENIVRVEFQSDSRNESFSRIVAAAFISRLDPTLEEMSDIKTAISEAVTNSIIHGYNNKGGKIVMEMYIDDKEFVVSIMDFGKGIEDINLAMEPMYTSSQDEERSGMGFVFMEAFMDELHVESEVNKGTTIRMKKKIGMMRGDSFDADFGTD